MVIFHSYVNVYQRVAISTWTDISGWWITTVQFSPKNDIPIPIHIVWNRSKISFRSPQFANGYWVISFRLQIQWIFSIWTIQYLVPNAVNLSGATGRRPLHKLRKLFIWLGWMKGGWGIHSQWGIHPTQTWELKCKRPNNGGNHWQNDNRIESTKSFGVLGSSQQISGMNTTFCLKREKTCSNVDRATWTSPEMMGSKFILYLGLKICSVAWGTPMSNHRLMTCSDLKVSWDLRSCRRCGPKYAVFAHGLFV